MSSPGSRRALGLFLILLLASGFALWRVAQVRVQGMLRNLGPLLVAQAEAQLGREIEVRRIVTDQPGLVLLEGVEVARGADAAASGRFAAADRITVRYNPALIALGTVLSPKSVGFAQAEVRAEGLRVWQAAPGDAPLFARARQAETSIDLGPLLRREGDPLATVAAVELTDTEVWLERLRNGRWNFEKILPRRPNAKPTAFRGELRFHRSRVHLTNRRTASLPGVARDLATGEATLRWADFPRIQFSGEGRVAGARGGPVRGSGHLHAKTKEWFTTLSGSSRDFRYWYRYFVPVRDDFRIHQAVGSAEVTAWGRGPGKGKPQVHLDLRLRSASGAIKGLGAPVDRFTGRLQVTGETVQVDGQAVAAGISARVTGDVVGGEQPALRLNLRSQSARLSSLKRLLPRLELPAPLQVPRPGKLNVRVEREGTERLRLQGTLEAPEVRYRDLYAAGVRARFTGASDHAGEMAASGRFTAERGRFREYAGAEAAGTFRFRRGLLHAEGTLRALGGRVTARGWIDQSTAPARFYASGTVTGIDLARLPREDAEQRLEGRASAEFVARGTEAAPVVSAYVTGGPLAVNELRLEGASARVRWTGEGVAVRYATALYRGAQLSGWGRWQPEGELDFHLQARDLELADLLTGELAGRISGQAFATVRVTGTVEKPALDGSLQVFEPRFDGREADYLSARFAGLAADRVELRQVELRRDDLRADSERLVLTRTAVDQPWQVEGEAVLAGLSVARALQLAGVDPARMAEHPVGGDLEPVRLSVRGPVDALAVQFQVASPRLVAQGIDLGRVELVGRVDTTARRLEITKGNARSEELSASIEGTVSLPEPVDGKLEAQDAAIDLRIEGRDLDLLRLARRYAPELLEQARPSGTLRLARVRASGTVGAPEIVADLTLAGTRLNDEPVEAEPFQVAWRPGAALVRGARLRLAGGEVELPYAALLLAKSVDAGQSAHQPLIQRLAFTARVSGVRIAAVRELVEASAAYRSADGAELRSSLEQLPTGLDGRVSLQLDLPLEGGIENRSLSEISRHLAARAGAARLQASASVPDLVLRPGADAGTLNARVNYTPGRFKVEQLRWQQAGTGTFTVTGERLTEEDGAPSTLRFSGTAEEVQLHTLAELGIPGLKERLARLEPLDGVLTFQAELTGTREQPDLVFGGKVAHPVLGGLPFDSIEVEGGRYSGARSELSIGSAVLTSRAEDSPAEARLAIGGTVPLTWPELSIPEDRPRKIRVELPEMPLSAFTRLANRADERAHEVGAAEAERVRPITALLRRVAAVEGVVRGDVTLGGSARVPNNNGELFVAAERLAVGSLQTEVKALRARLQLEGDRLRVAELSAESSRGGRLTGSGTVRLGAGPDESGAMLDLALRIDGVRFVERKLGTVAAALEGTRAEGTLQSVEPTQPEAPAPITIRGPWDNPTIAGGVRVDDASLLLALRSLPPRESEPLPFNPRLDLRIFAGENVRLRNAQVRFNLADSLHAQGTLLNPLVQGDLRVIRGSITLPGMRLRNVEGLLRISYDARERDFDVPAPPPVYVDISGSTTLRVLRTTALDSRYYDATFRIQGTPLGQATAASDLETSPIRRPGSLSFGDEGGLQLSVRTEPPLPGGEIEALIRQQLGVEGFEASGSNVVETLGGQLEQAFSASVGSAVTGRIEEALQSALGLDVFALDLGVSQPLRVRLGKRLFGPLYGTVTQEFGVGNTSQRQFELYYRLSPQLRIGYRQEEPFDRQVLFFSGTFSF